LTIFLTLLCLALAGLWIALPRLAQTVLVPMLAENLNAPDMRVNVRRVDFKGLDLGEITLSGDIGPKVKAVLVDWSLSGLVQGRLEKVRIFGFEASVRKNGEKWEIPGLPEIKKSSGTKSTPAFVPSIDELFVDGQVSLDENGTHLPFSIQGSLSDEARLLLDAQTALAGQNVGITIDANLRQNEFRLTCALPPASLAALSSLMPGRVPPLTGTLGAAIKAVLPADGKPRLSAELDLTAFESVLGGLPVVQEGNAQARFGWDQKPRLDLSPISLAAPLPLTLSVTDITANLDDMAFGCAFDLRLHALPDVVLSSPLRLAGRTDLHATDLGWSVRTRAELDALEARTAGLPDLSLTLKKSVLSIDLAANATGALVDAALDLGQVRVDKKPFSATLSGLSLTCKAAMDPNPRGTLNISGARLEVRQPDLALTATRLDAQCDFALDDRFSASAVVRANASAKSGDGSAIMSLRLPLTWPDPAAQIGSMDIDVKWKGKGLAKISSRVAQDLHGAKLDGTISTLPIALRASMKGHISPQNISQSWLDIKASQDIFLPGNLKSLLPALADLSGNARLDATARLDMSRGRPRIPVSAKLGGLSLAHAKSKLTLSGGALELGFSDLMELRSDPDGRASFERMQIGTIVLERGDIHFQVEALHSILVEGCRFDWAGGRIGSQAFRINPNVEDYTVELYCDRVQMVQALEQFGMTQAQGGGTANGRIPVHYANGNLSFDNGFLYSTPGEKGVLKVKGTEILTAGIPPNTPQYGQLDLAAEALKDFSYEWARIRLNTQDKELVVSLELDGKPEKPLPFTYDRDFGGFARVSASSPGSVFQGIRLDVNFRLPLDQLLQYRQLLELMKNGG
jgi:hypothetical protein